MFHIQVLDEAVDGLRSIGHAVVDGLEVAHDDKIGAGTDNPALPAEVFPGVVNQGG